MLNASSADEFATFYKEWFAGLAGLDARSSGLESIVVDIADGNLGESLNSILDDGYALAF